MALLTERHRLVDASSLLGILAGMGLLMTACFVPAVDFLAVPAFLILVPSLLLGMR